MRRIEKFETEDGRLFDKQSEAEKHEELYFKIEEIIKLLGGTNKEIDPNTSNFVNGGGYYTIPEKDHANANELMSKLVNSILPGFPGLSSRVVYEHPLLGKAGAIYNCIKDGKRYGQPYYANNPEQAENLEWNKDIKCH